LISLNKKEKRYIRKEKKVQRDPPLTLSGRGKRKKKKGPHQTSPFPRWEGRGKRSVAKGRGRKDAA